MNKYLRYALKGFGFFILFLLLVYVAVYVYVSINKKSIITQVTSEISEKISGEVTIGNVELSLLSQFPNISVLVEKVSIKDSMFATHKHPFLEVDKAYVNLNLKRLISRQPPLSGLKLENGNIYLYTDTSGYSNGYLFKQKNDPASVAASTKQNRNNELKNIKLQDIRIVIEDLKKEKLHDLTVNNLKAEVNENNDQLSFKIKEDILVNSLAFNLPAGSFAKGRAVKGDYVIHYNKKTKQLQFNDVEINIGGQPFSFRDASFDLEGPSPQFKLKIEAVDVDYAFARSLLTKKIDKALSIVNIKLDKPLTVNVSLDGPLRGGDPLIDIYWTIKNSQLATPFFDFDNASFKGHYTNEVVKGLPRKDPNSKIELDQFTAKWHGLPFTSDSIRILNLTEPLLIGNLKTKIALSTLNQSLNSSTINFNSGSGLLNLNYKGPLARNNNTNSFINGFINISNGSITYVPRNVELQQVASTIVFKSSDVFVQKLQAVVLGNKIVMQGVAKNLLSIVSSEPNKAVIDWNIYSPSLNLASFAYLLQPQKKVVQKKSAENSLQKTANDLDQVIAQGSVHVKLNADKLYYKKFTGTNAVADLSLLNEKYLLNQVSLKHAGGSMNITGAMEQTAPNYNQANVQISLANMNVNEVFNAFNNFGQDGITAQNLRGNLTSNVKLAIAVNGDGEVYKDAVKGTVDFSLKKGALINYEPIKKMQVFILKNRDFDNITFAELKDRLEIKNQEIKINQLEIQSSVLTMFVSGIYSMKGNTDMQIRVPLSNLKKRDENYVPKNLEDGKKAGASIYLRGTPGKDGNIKFKIDLFNKLRGDKDDSK